MTEPCESADHASESARNISQQCSLHLDHPWQAHNAHEWAASRHEVESATTDMLEKSRHLKLASEHRMAAEYWAKKESESNDARYAINKDEGRHHEA